MVPSDRFNQKLNDQQTVRKRLGRTQTEREGEEMNLVKGEMPQNTRREQEVSDERGVKSDEEKYRLI